MITIISIMIRIILITYYDSDYKPHDLDDYHYDYDYDDDYYCYYYYQFFVVTSRAT